MFFKLLLSIAEMGWTFLWVFLKKLQVRCWCVGRVPLVVQVLSSAWAPAGAVMGPGEGIARHAALQASSSLSAKSG